MKKYLVKVIKNFNDYQGKPISENTTPISRNKGDIFECSRDRYLFLKENDVVYLVGIINKNVKN